jgi:peptidoglycan hydrolase CwlO-like protein
MMNGETKEYRSSPRKLARFFERSRDIWKARCGEAKYRVKLLHTKVADLQKSRERWKEETKQLRSEVRGLQEELERLQGELQEQKACTAAR